MAEEIIDIVDKSGHVVGQMEREQAHRKRLLHHSVGILLYTPDGEVVLEKRSRTKRIAPGKWGIPAGHVLSGHTLGETAKKELAEELFHNLPEPNIPLTQLFTFIKRGDGDREFRTMYAGMHPGPFSPQPEEVDEVRTMGLAELEHDIERDAERYTQTTAEILEQLRRRNMLGELLDVIDREDKVIGQLPVGESYRRGALKRSVGVLIFRDRACTQVALQRRSISHKVQPGKWSFVSGLVPAGKGYMETARRELAEEMFHNKAMPDITIEELFKMYKEEDEDPGFIAVFQTFHDGEFCIEPHEVMDYKWVGFEELLKDVERNPSEYTGTFKVALGEYRRRQNDHF